MTTMLTDQEIFDKSTTHLFEQGCKSLFDNGTCAYRSEEGLMCAAGVLIKDEFYSKQLEGKKSDSGMRSGVHAALCASGVDSPLLVRSLQNVHDNNPVESWPGLLLTVAARYGLNGDVVRARFPGSSPETLGDFPI